MNHLWLVMRVKGDGETPTVAGVHRTRADADKSARGLAESYPGATFMLFAAVEYWKAELPPVPVAQVYPVWSSR